MKNRFFLSGILFLFIAFIIANNGEIQYRYCSNKDQIDFTYDSSNDIAPEYSPLLTNESDEDDYELKPSFVRPRFTVKKSIVKSGTLRKNCYCNTEYLKLVLFETDTSPPFIV